ncbi:MAG: hypothetical protein ACRDBH_05660 [Bosea sp. (in: a-proteobacteria)]
MKTALKSLIVLGMLAATPVLADTGDAAFNAEARKIATMRSQGPVASDAGIVASGLSHVSDAARSGAK